MGVPASKTSEPAPPLLTSGADVVTFDNKRVGTVRECASGYFQVESRWSRKYWLSSVLVRDATGDEVKLQVSREVLDRYKCDGPMVTLGASSDRRPPRSAVGSRSFAASNEPIDIRPRQQQIEHLSPQGQRQRSLMRWPLSLLTGLSWIWTR